MVSRLSGPVNAARTLSSSSKYRERGGSVIRSGFLTTESPMPAGTPMRNPADLLGSPRFSKLIEELRAHFDWIVLDSPPVLAVADPCMIARVASGVLLVLDCGRTSRDVAAAAVQRLEAVSAPILGAMLNRVVLDGRGESYLPYYHRSYQAYYPQDENNLLPSELPPAVSE